MTTLNLSRGQARPATTRSGRELFRNEIARARRLGFRLQLAVNEQTNVTAARAVPDTPRARANVMLAAGEPGQVIEATQPYAEPGEAASMLRLCIESVLERAAEVA